MERNGAERIEFLLDVADGLGMRDVAEIHDIHAESAEASVAEFAAVFDALGDAERAVIAGPGSSVAGKEVFLVFGFFPEALAGNPPAGDFLDFGGSDMSTIMMALL